VVVGVGGGKAMDTAKAVGHVAGVKWASVPTIVSTDTPTSALAVIYTDESVFEEYTVDAEIVCDAMIAADGYGRALHEGRIAPSHPARSVERAAPAPGPVVDKGVPVPRRAGLRRAGDQARPGQQRGESMLGRLRRSVLLACSRSRCTFV
jgi:hypothetical protein